MEVVDNRICLRLKYFTLYKRIAETQQNPIPLHPHPIPHAELGLKSRALCTPAEFPAPSRTFMQCTLNWSSGVTSTWCRLLANYFLKLKAPRKTIIPSCTYSGSRKPVTHSEWEKARGRKSLLKKLRLGVARLAAENTWDSCRTPVRFPAPTCCRSNSLWL